MDTKVIKGLVDTYKFNVAKEIVKSLEGQKACYTVCTSGSDVVVNLYDIHERWIGYVHIKDNEIRVIYNDWSYLDCFCGIDQTDKAVRAVKDIIDYSIEQEKQ